VSIVQEDGSAVYTDAKIETSPITRQELPNLKDEETYKRLIESDCNVYMELSLESPLGSPRVEALIVEVPQPKIPISSYVNPMICQ